MMRSITSSRPFTAAQIRLRRRIDVFRASSRVIVVMSARPCPRERVESAENDAPQRRGAPGSSAGVAREAAAVLGGSEGRAAERAREVRSRERLDRGTDLAEARREVLARLVRLPHEARLRDPIERRA